jgi:hypothetical protein
MASSVPSGLGVTKKRTRRVIVQHVLFKEPVGWSEALSGAAAIRISTEPPETCEELCGRRAFRCTIAPRQCAVAVNGSSDNTIADD